MRRKNGMPAILHRLSNIVKKLNTIEYSGGTTESVSGQPVPAGVLLAVSRDKPHHENGRVHPAIDVAEIS
jgi:hypothetical protein